MKKIKTKIEGYGNIYKDYKGMLYTGGLSVSRKYSVEGAGDDALAKGVKFT